MKWMRKEEGNKGYCRRLNSGRAHSRCRKEEKQKQCYSVITKKEKEKVKKQGGEKVGGEDRKMTRNRKQVLLYHPGGKEWNCNVKSLLNNRIYCNL